MKRGSKSQVPLRVVMVSAEAVPFSKVGGLADVLGALPAALQRIGAEVCVVAPRYPALEPGGVRVIRYTDRPTLRVPGPWTDPEAEVWLGTLPESAVKVFLIRHPEYFDREGVYTDPATGLGYRDNAARFEFFSRAALDLAAGFRPPPNIIHLHDNHPCSLALQLRGPGAPAREIQRAGLVFTIHNMAFQGLLAREEALGLGAPAEAMEVGGCLEFYGQANYMKAALVLADRVTTVSPRYAQEIQQGPEFGFGLEGVLASRSEDLVGILNGVDYAVWDPSHDWHLPAPYNRDDLAGKAVNRRALCEEVGLPVPTRRPRPVLGMISRLANQKGFDILAEIAEEILARDVQFVVLGTGEQRYHRWLEELVKKYPRQVAACFRFSEHLAHLIEAGADMFLMPSLYEPCGLNQIYSLRYGTIPIVRATGGLADTVTDCDASPREGTGFVFKAYEGTALLEALDRALAAFRDGRRWRAIVRRAMAADFGWERSAEAYRDLYVSVLREKEPWAGGGGNRSRGDGGVARGMNLPSSPRWPPANVWCERGRTVRVRPGGAGPLTYGGFPDRLVAGGAGG